MSRSSTLASGRRRVPVRRAVVVPGKFDVLARAPHSWLNSVVLPVLGLPTRTAWTPPRGGKDAKGIECGTGSGAIGTYTVYLHGSRIWNDVEVAGHDA